MNLQQRSPGEAPPAASPTPRRGRWNWLRVVQGAWIVFAFLLLVAFVTGLPALFQNAQTVCTLSNPGNCATDQLTPVYVQVLNQLHFPVAAAASLLVTLTFAISLLYWLVGFLIFWRKSQEWMGLLTSLMLVMWGAVGLGGFTATAQTPLFLQILANIVTAAIGPVFFLFLFTFPTGRFAARWIWAVFMVIFVMSLLSSLPLTASFIPSWLVALTYPLPVVVQVYRYVRIYDTIQRQQTKWFVFGVSVVLLLILIEGVLGQLAPDSAWYQLFNGPMWLVIWTVMLASVSIPIFRYRLWDIDIIINRTLVYGSLTVLLVGLYVGLILVLQVLVHAVTGNLGQYPPVIVGSTLVIAALFQPLRRGLQALIDRRFYRRKYDASKVMGTFSATLRNEVDLDQLREHLLAVVQETIQPSHASLWVRQPGWKDAPSKQSRESTPEEIK